MVEPSPHAHALETVFQTVSSEETLNLLCGNKLVFKLLGELDTILSFAKIVIDDADEKPPTDNRVRKWSDNLKDMVYQNGS